jgi:hypothetical protein
MHQAIYLAIGAFLFALSVWAFRIIYLDSGAGPTSAPSDTGGAGATGSSKDIRKSSPALSAAIVLVITVMQLYRVAQDPSRTFSWVVLGVGLIACVLVVVGLSRRRASRS